MYRASAYLIAPVLLLMQGMQAHALELDEVAVMLEGEKYTEALQGLDNIARTRDSRLLRAAALAGLSRSDEAEALYLELIEESPKDPTPYNNLARLYARQGKLQHASELLTEGLKSDTRYATIYKNLSSVYVEMSRNAYAKALRLDDKAQGLQLRSLDHRDAPEGPVRLAMAEEGEKQPAVEAAPQETEAPTKEAPVTPDVIEPVPTDVTEPEVGEPPDEIEAIAALEKWATAWSAQDVEAYLAAYDEAFQPRRGNTLEQWRTERRTRLQKPGSIEVTLSEFDVLPQDGGKLKVRLVQRYRSATYSDVSRKGFTLKSRNGGWKIMDEYTIEVLR